MSDGLYDWLLFAHVVAAMIWLGGAVVIGVLAIRVVRGGEPEAIGRFLAKMRVVGPLVLAPATVGVVGFGVWLVLDSGSWDFGQFWVDFGLILFAVAFVIGAAHQSRTAIGAERGRRRRGATKRRVGCSSGGCGATWRSSSCSSSRLGT